MTLDCKDCAYYRACSEKGFEGLDLAICDLADVLFLQNVEDLELEYPCSKVNFNEYLAKKAAARPDPASISKFVKPELFRELKDAGVCMLKFPDGIIEKCFQDHLQTQITRK